MKIAATTFIIPFAFVYSPVLMSFPHLTWNVVPQILEVLAIQFTVSIAAYGYYLRNLNVGSVVSSAWRRSSASSP